MAVFISLCVDDLEARSDPARSSRIATYDMTDEDRRLVLGLIEKYRRNGDDLSRTIAQGRKMLDAAERTLSKVVNG